MSAPDIHRAVVTGPTGAVGVALCARLLQGGAEVYAVVRPESPRAAHLPCGVTKICCDLGELERLPELIPSGADAFFHLGWAHTIGPGRNDAICQLENAKSAVQAVKSAAALGCEVFVGVGSQAEYGPSQGILTEHTPCFPINGYGIAKLCAGQMTRLEAARLGIRHLWARILSVYGPYDTEKSVISLVIRALLAGEKPSLTAGEQQWDYLYSSDAAEALARLARQGQNGHTYVLGSGAARPLREYLTLLRDEIDPALPLGLGELPYPLGQAMRLQADISALQTDTGFAPAVDFKRGIRETIRQARLQEGK